MSKYRAEVESRAYGQSAVAERLVYYRTKIGYADLLPQVVALFRLGSVIEEAEVACTGPVDSGPTTTGFVKHMVWRPAPKRAGQESPDRMSFSRCTLRAAAPQRSAVGSA